MQPFTIHTGTAFAMQEDGRLMANIDTDMIIPKQFLKTLTRKGLSKGLFYDLRTNADGEPNADFVLNQPQAQGTSILIAGENFGCGSSREHAPWALKDHGIACVIAPSFADIFHTNCLKNGLLPIVLDAKTCAALAGQSGGNNCRFSIDLSAQTLSAPDGSTHTFAIDSGVKENLLKGRDEIGQALSFEHEIQRFERTRNADMPWLPLMTETHTP